MTRGPDVVAMPGGSPLEVRTIRPTDAGPLVALHARLSADTIYRRYFGARRHLSPADVERLTHVDGRARFALVAVRDENLLAVARYEGQPGRRDAELAVVVDDAVQHQGIGRLMLARLVDVAHEAGLHELVADVLPGNAAMLGLLRSLGRRSRRASDGETVTVTLDLTGMELPADRRERARGHLNASEADRPSS